MLLVAAYDPLHGRSVHLPSGHFLLLLGRSGPGQGNPGEPPGRLQTGAVVVARQRAGRAIKKNLAPGIITPSYASGQVLA
jgi:hypothetical protein